jgi:hypothetical protein
MAEGKGVSMYDIKEILIKREDLRDSVKNQPNVSGVIMIDGLSSYIYTF